MIEQNVSKRVTAYLLDVFFVYLLIMLITSIRFINPTYDKLLEISQNYTDITEKYNKDEIKETAYLEATKDYVYDVTKYNISTSLVTIIVIFGYFGVFQKYNNGQTLGKKIVKIKVVDNSDKPLGLVKYFLRILPMQYVLIGSVIPVLLDTVLVFVLDKNLFSVVYTILVYSFAIIGVVSFILMNIRKDKKGLHDLLVNSKVVSE